MKKLLTLALCIGAAFFASAQGNREMEDVKDVILGPRKGSGSTSGSDKDVILGRDDRRVNENDRNRNRTSSSTEANRINREYDAKIQSIRNNRQLSASEKERTIRQLEADRNRKLRNLDERYSKDRRRYEDRDRDDDRRYSKDNKNKNKNYKNKKKGNNGNHYGWQKGKGNPHRDRD